MIRIAGCTKKQNLVWITAGSLRLPGTLEIPKNAQGIVLFIHGSGSVRDNYRNQFVAQVLHQAQLATLLIDLLTAEEEAIDLRTQHHLRFDIGLLAARVVSLTDWLYQNSTTRDLNVGYFASSTGSAAAMLAATERPGVVSAIVSRGGRPDLAGSALSRVKAPTLLIVGENNIPVREMNQEAFLHLHTPKRLGIIPGATHLFEEPGALEEVAKLASRWFSRYLTPTHRGLHQPKTSLS